MKHPSPALSPTLSIDMVDHLLIKHHPLPVPLASLSPSQPTSSDHDPLTPLKIETSWTDPVRLPYVPSTKGHDASTGSSSTSPVDDPIYFFSSTHGRPKKHFGFSARQSIAASIFPWQKRKPVCYPYSPFGGAGEGSQGGGDLARLNLKTLPVAKAAAVKHLENEELDLLSSSPEARATRTLQLLHLLHVQDWVQVTDPSLIQLHRISGALTNCVFLVTGPSDPASPPLANQPLSSATESSPPPPPPPRPRKVLLRVYGVGLESLVSRDRELHWLQNLSTMDIGPSLLGIFKNGRFEEYVDSRTLTKEDLRDARVSRCIAHRMCELHNIVNVFPNSNKGYGGQTGENIAKWIPLARQAIEAIGRKDFEKRQVMERFGFEQLVGEIDQVQREIAASVNSPIVFAHNDTQYGNILQTLDASPELVVIDFEYAGYNTRGFDIGNHFCEWMADYHSPRPSLMHQNRYPTKAEQLNFLEAYVEAEIAITGYHLTAMDPHQFASHNGGGVSKAEILDIMYREVNKYALTSHIMWGLWGLIQASQSEIDFDYFEYALQRLTAFREKREEFMNL
ncbi:hypothetical protein BGZ82_004117 [Podila clonocystis]|nr:hypothetical protein BGZ82_004117 [Podila clonocystis]